MTQAQGTYTPPAKKIAARSLVDFSYLADGALITRLYFGIRFVRVTGLKGGRVIHRSYRHDQIVKVLDYGEYRWRGEDAA